MSQAVDLDAIPPLPYVAHEILMAVNNDDSSAEQVGQALEREPGLTARVVALANAAFFTRHRPVYSTGEAVIRLGLDRVRVLATSVLLAQQFDPGRCPAFRAEAYWLRAVGTAFAAGRLAGVLPGRLDADAAYLAGLLHNIGLLLLIHVYPEELHRLLHERDGATAESLAAELRPAVGVDQHEAGAMLLEAWGLPQAAVETARQMGRSRPEGPWAALVQAVQYAAAWSRAAFAQLPQVALPAGTEDAALLRIGAQCRREWDQLQAIAQLLARG